MEWVTWLFIAAIAAVIAVTWLASTGRIDASIQPPHGTDIEWAQQSAVLSAQETIVTERVGSGAPPEDTQGACPWPQ